MTDGLAKDGLTDVYDGKAMGNAAELCASSCASAGEDQDAFAVESYRRSQQPRQPGKFKDEIVPVEIPQRKGDPFSSRRMKSPLTLSSIRFLN